jgi:hypothetical protein
MVNRIGLESNYLYRAQEWIRLYQTLTPEKQAQIDLAYPNMKQRFEIPEVTRDSMRTAPKFDAT